MDPTQMLLLATCFGNMTLTNFVDDVKNVSQKPSSRVPRALLSPANDDKNVTIVTEIPSGKVPDMDGKKLSLEGKTLKIGTLSDLPLSDFKMNASSKTFIGSGIAFNFIELLRREFGFSYTVVPTPENSAENSMKMVADGEVDMAAAFLPVIQETRERVIFSATLATEQWVVLLRRPQESASGSSLLAPFDKKVWILILLSLSIVGPVMYAIIIIRVKLCRGNARLTKVFPLTSCVWFVYGALMKQGSTLNPISDSSRLLFATWWIFITVVTAFYTANLTAFLTLSRFTLPINGPDDIAKKSYDWIGLHGSSFERIIEKVDYTIFLRQEDESFASLKKSLYVGLGQFLNSSDEELVELVRKDGLMFIREKRVVDRLLFRDYMKKVKEGVEESQRCVFAVTPDSFLSLPLAFVFPKNSTLPNVFNPKLTSLVEAGIVDHLIQHDLPQSEICPLDLGNKDRQLRNSDLTTTYQAVGIGLIVAAIAFIVEQLLNFWKKWKNRKSKNKLLKQKMRPPIVNILSVYPWFNSKWAVSQNINIEKKFEQSRNGESYNMNLKDTNIMCDEMEGKLSIYNGREYIRIGGEGQATRLIPIRTPSAVLFDKAYKERSLNISKKSERNRPQKVIGRLI